ncbi:stage III sporulation protein AA [Jeotgalibacillus proteolyticus]|uniref:stage III sporulation protein AA n=1 Tax=Jeotgalibacillus proteolyticus TaxID=2082395 RepID=UPI003CF037C8
MINCKGVDGMHTILSLFPERLQHLLVESFTVSLVGVEEIRIRIGRPVQIENNHGTADLDYVPSHNDRQHIAEKISQHSFYSLEEEMKKGYVTVEGGHRVGIAGKVTLEEGRVKAIQSISSFAIRIASEQIGCADPFMDELWDPIARRWQHCLLIGPPKSGKTTLLRDFARYISLHHPGSEDRSKKISIVDERSEIAACHHGVPQLTFGTKIDVLDRCPKLEGMTMMIRSMSPEVMIVDEIGHERDIYAIMDAMYTGVSMIMTAHANSIEELQKRSIMDKLLQSEIRHYILCNQTGYTLFRNGKEIIVSERKR